VACRMQPGWLAPDRSYSPFVVSGLDRIRKIGID